MKTEIAMLAALKAALAKIRARSRWTQGRFFVREHGLAVKWCALGALIHVTPGDSRLYAKCARLLNRHSTSRGLVRLEVINDSAPASVAHRRVLGIYRAAIKELEQAK